MNLHDIVLLAHEHLTACQRAITHATNREQLTEATRLAFEAEYIATSLRRYIESGDTRDIT
jgi:hypothetical protein